MKVLLVAPRICTPWTEGRKKFVRDLCTHAGTSWQLCGLVTVDEGEAAALPREFEALTVTRRQDHLLLLVRNLEDAIRRHRPDLVCHFPFGAFGGLRGLANLWAIRRVARIARRAGVPCCTIMYSLTSEANGLLYRLLLRDVYFNQYSGHGKSIRFGVGLPAPLASQYRDPAGKTLLFMDGTAESGLERLDYVLDVRGLRLLLQAGRTLSEAGYKLVVAVPFLKDPTMLALLTDHPDNHWAKGQIRYLDEVRVPDIFTGITAFVFPYGQEERQFVPTSIVEAMYYGIPVVLPRLEFLAQFHLDTGRSLAHDPADAVSLVAQILRLQSAPAEVEAICERARSFALAEYSIANSVADIEEISRRLRTPG